MIIPYTADLTLVQDLTPVPGKCAIYGLYDPRDLRLRYIGKSVRPRTRLVKHRNPDGVARLTRNSRWVLGLKALGLTPILQVLVWVDLDCWAATEQEFITTALQDGIELTNLSPGGDGSMGASHGPEARAKVSAAQTGRIRTPEERAAIGAARLGRKDSAATKQRKQEAASRFSNSPEGREIKRRAGLAKQAPHLRQKASEQMKKIWAERKKLKQE